MATDWSQFTPDTPVPDAAPAAAVDWSQFTPDAPPSLGDKIKAALGATGTVPYGTGAGYLIDNPLTRGLAKSVNTAATGLNEGVRRVFLAPADATINALGGHGTLSQDFTQNAIAPAVATNPQLAAPASAGIGSDVIQMVGNLGGSIATAMAAGGAGEVAPVVEAAPTAGGMIANAMTSPALRTAAVLGTTGSGAQAAAMDANGQPVSNAQLASMALADTDANLLPMGHGLPYLARPLVGAASGVGGRALSDLTTGQRSTPADYVTSAATAAALGLLPGGGEAKPTPLPEAEPAPVTPPQAQAQQAAKDASANVGGGSTAASLVAKNAAEAGLAPADVAAHTAAADAMVKADPDAEVPLHPATPIDATTSVPLGGGGSKDNSVNFIDKRIPQFIDVPKPDGTVVKVDAHDVIANAHEAPEKTQLDQGKDYADAHNVNANTYEETYLKEKYGVTHDAFNEALQPYLDKAETEGAGASDISPNLDTKPYVDDGVEHLLDPNASKVTDDKGKPLTVYHGTANDFDQFEDRSGESTAHATSPLGHFFTPDRASAEGYARNASEGRPADERVMQAQLDIKKPYEMPLDEAQAIETPDQARQVRAHLEAQGYDGIHLPDQNAWVAFHPHQISLTGDNDPFHVELQQSRQATAAMAPEDRSTAMDSLGLDVAPEHQADVMSIADLVDKAVDAGADPKDIIAAMTGTASEKARKLWALGKPDTDHANTESAELQSHSARSAEPPVAGTAGDHGNGSAQARVSGADSDAVDSTPADQRSAEPEPTADRVARSEPTPETTGIKHATVAEERALKGKDEVDYEGKRTFGEAWDTASKKLEDDPGAGQDLARTINEKPRPLSAEESATLIQDRMRLKNSFRDANADIAQAVDDKDVNAEAVARAKLRTVEDALEANDQASKASGYEQGFGLAARRMMSREDYSMADLLTQAKAAAGRDLTPAERGQIERLSKMIEEKDAQIAELQKTKAQRKSGVTGGARKTADQHFKDLSAQLKLIAQKDQLEPGCVV